MRYAYELHMHSCLSPCGDADNTPANLAAMCALAGVRIAALTDHNAVGNCPAFCQAAERCGLLALPGMELTTREEAHVVCLFSRLEEALAFGEEIRERLPALKNKPAVFGEQLIMDAEDNVLGEETALLSGAADVGVYDTAALAERFNGVAFPAHIDRPSFSLLANLGLWDPDMGFPLAEVSAHCPPDLFQRPDLRGVRHITNCDAHALDQIPDAYKYMDLPELTAEAVLGWLRGEIG